MLLFLDSLERSPLSPALSLHLPLWSVSGSACLSTCLPVCVALPALLSNFLLPRFYCYFYCGVYIISFRYNYSLFELHDCPLLSLSLFPSSSFIYLSLSSSFNPPILFHSLSSPFSFLEFLPFFPFSLVYILVVMFPVIF